MSFIDLENLYINPTRGVGYIKLSLLRLKKGDIMEKSIYKTIIKDGKTYVVMDSLQAIANIYDYNKKLGAKYAQ